MSREFDLTLKRHFSACCNRFGRLWGHCYWTMFRIYFHWPEPKMKVLVVLVSVCVWRWEAVSHHANQRAREPILKTVQWVSRPNFFWKQDPEFNNQYLLSICINDWEGENANFPIDFYAFVTVYNAFSVGWLGTSIINYSQNPSGTVTLNGRNTDAFVAKSFCVTLGIWETLKITGWNVFFGSEPRSF